MHRGLRTGAALLSLVAGCALTLLAAMPARAADTAFPRPAALERDVEFWIRVYTEINTNSGFLHDENNLNVVYETLQFSPTTSPRERMRLVDSAHDRYVAALKRIATGMGPLSESDQKVRALWGDEGTPIRLLEATHHIRFQLGQSDRFRAGLVRSGQWETHIAETLANLGLPPELAVLPHVESSFNPAAYSKVGAAGLWQFMRSTGRRYMRIDRTVDDRMDPFRATEAAAQLLSYNYRLLGTWPLALTAYNHGAGGMRRAKDEVGTDDITAILRNYRSPSFGFASRNYYVSFLAALEIDHNPEKYFGAVEHAPEAKFTEIALPVNASVATLERALKVDHDTLRSLNPALLPACWRGQRPVPSGYRLRLPLEEKWTPQLVAQRLGASPGAVLAVQAEQAKHRVLPGETLASIADAYGVNTSTLARLNGLKSGARVRVGNLLRVPEGQPAVVRVAAHDATSDKIHSASAAPDGSAGLESGTASATAATPPVATASDFAATSPEQAAPAEAAPEDTGPPVYIVQGDESLADIAQKVGIPESRLLKINGMNDPDFLFEGQRLLLVVANGADARKAADASDAPAPARVRSTRTAAVAGEAPGGVSAAVAERESDEDAAAVAATKHPAVKAQPVSADQAEELGPALGPAAGEASESTDPNDYSVSKDGTIVVAAAETLGHYADWLGISAGRLRTINHLRSGRPVLMGHKVKLEFHRVSREAFEAKRGEYHRTLEASYFAAHRITGTEVYIARRGDSLWTVTQRYEHLPVWLLQQYNPDVDFSAMRAGTQIVVPRVEDVVNAGG
jgi:membrane-bound lytic murein transglycosylase D